MVKLAPLFTQMSHLNKFPLGVEEKLGFYVYCLIDPRDDQIFYIGKGCGNRIFAHIDDALETFSLNDRLDKIREIHTAGQQVRHLVHRHGLTEKEAFEVESALIDFLTVNKLTNQVHGYNSDDRGQMLLSEVIAKYEAPVIDIKEPVILITVNRFYRRGIGADELYEITRGKWVIDPTKHKPQYAFSVFRGVVREVYQIDRWLLASIDESEIRRKWIADNAIDSIVKRTKRWQFEGRIAHSLKHYVGGNVEAYSKVGAQNPIRYVNC
jgi:uncharacterized protein